MALFWENICLHALTPCSLLILEDIILAYTGVHINQFVAMS